jgi:hypothetical protein
MRVNIMSNTRRRDVNRRTTRNKQHPRPKRFKTVIFEGRAASPAKTTETTPMLSGACDKRPGINEQTAKPLKKLNWHITARELVPWLKPTHRETPRIRIASDITANRQISIMCHLRKPTRSPKARHVNKRRSTDLRQSQTGDRPRTGSDCTSTFPLDRDFSHSLT